LNTEQKWVEAYMPNDDPEERDEERPERKKIEFNVGEPRKREPTGDPDKDALYAMTFKEFGRVVDDESDPLHAKALEVQKEMFAPIYAAVNRISMPEFKTASAKLADAFAKAAPGLKIKIPDAFSTKDLFRPISMQDIVPSGPVPEAIDVRAVADAVGTAAYDVQQIQADRLNDLVTYARAEKEERDADALDRAIDRAAVRGARTAGWWAAGGGIAATLIAAATLVATLVKP